MRVFRIVLWSFYFFYSTFADFVSKTKWIQPNQLYPNQLSYKRSIIAVAQNEVVSEDGSNGIVWFNTSSYCIKNLEFREVGFHAVVTYESYNYLTLLVRLADEALAKGFHGDYVFLLFKFHHEGRELPSGIRRFSPMLYDMAKSLDSISTFENQRQPLLDFLKSSTKIKNIKELYDIVASERKTRLMRFYRSLARRLGRLVLDYKDSSLYFVFIRFLGVPVRSKCKAESIYAESFVSFDKILEGEIDECKNNKDLQFFRQACVIKLIIPRESILRGTACYN